MDNVISSAKTDMFRIRMNPEIREELEQIYAKTALARLVKELKKGDDCTESYSAEQARAMLGIAE